VNPVATLIYLLMI